MNELKMILGYIKILFSNIANSISSTLTIILIFIYGLAYFKVITISTNFLNGTKFFLFLFL